MKRMKFECTLLSDIVLNQSSSSMGNQKSLDFIPGGCFLGIVAAELYGKGVIDDLDVFHSGRVRFGDAHPATNGIRGLKVPAAMYYPKLKKPSEELYIHHCIENQEVLKDLQLKQCREGFYAFDNNSGKPIDTHKGFTIKSAYDSDKRRSEDGLMFGYEYLSKGLTLYFEIESDLDVETNNCIVDALTDNAKQENAPSNKKGERLVGHSRTAEFGRVSIKKLDGNEEYKDVTSNATPVTIKVDGKEEKCVVIYADARLIFLNENGEPTCQPSVNSLLGKNEKDEVGEIVWEKSQIRTFQYAPWNFKRQSYDTDRCGIEKGSVFVVRLKDEENCPTESQYVGCYKNEGFGKVIYNPEFLTCKAGKNGDAEYRLENLPKPEKPIPQEIMPNTDLLKYLAAKQKASTSKKTTYSIVEDEIGILAPLFSKGQFASQWSSIRSLAMITPDGQKLKEVVEIFLSHGVAEAKWSEMGRQKALDSFMQKLLDDQNYRDNMQDIMINLASEMAKRC